MSAPIFFGADLFYMKNFKNIFFGVLVLFAFACEKGSEEQNQAPDTTFSVESINLTGENRLNSIVRLTWYGTDPDGYVNGFELSRDLINWDYTTIQDSTFKFSISGNSDTADIKIYVRAIDNENLTDPTPAELSIPIRNTAPTVEFDDNLTIPDTAYLVATTQWSAADIDGDETVTNVLISLNGAKWYEVNKTKRIFSIVPTDPSATDTTNALVYYATDANPASLQIEGLLVNDTNRILIKAIDQAGAESKIDTSSTFYLKGKTNDLLIVSGTQNISGGIDPNSVYNSIFQQINAPFDYFDLTVGNGKYQPKIWNITFKLQLAFYTKLFFHADNTLYTNPYTGTKLLLLEYAALSLQEYANSGGKYLLSTSFAWDTNIDGFKGTLPLESLSSENYGGNDGTTLYRDSAIVSSIPGYPDLSPTDFRLPAIGVYNIDSLDSEVLYTANVTKGRNGVWTNTKTIASGRRQNGKLNQIYFAIQLWQLRNDPAELNNLFNQIINVEFN